MKFFVAAILALMVLTSLTTPATAAEPKPPEVGDKAKDFELPVVGGDKFVKLSDEYKEGPVVVVVLRGFPGYQCPVCSRQVGALRNRVKALADKAQRVILVYPGAVDSLDAKALEFKGQSELPDPLVMVRDDEMKMVSDWGLRWDEPRETAYPSTFVIDGNGRIKWAMVSESHGGRSSVEEILKQL